MYVDGSLVVSTSSIQCTGETRPLHVKEHVKVRSAKPFTCQSRDPRWFARFIHARSQVVSDCNQVIRISYQNLAIATFNIFTISYTHLIELTEWLIKLQTCQPHRTVSRRWLHT